MSRRVVDLDDFSSVLGEFTDASLKAKRSAVAKGLARSIPDLVAASPVDTGLYAASWGFSVQEKSALLGNYAPYAGVIEYGTRRFTPPLAPLLAWAKRVLTGTRAVGADGTPGTGPVVDTGQPETDYSPEVWALAIGTQKKIAAVGMAPRHIMENMIPTIIGNIRDELRASG